MRNANVRTVSHRNGRPTFAATGVGICLMISLIVAGCGGSPPVESTGDSELNLHNTTARLEFEHGDVTSAAASYERALDRARAMDDPSGIAAAGYDLGICRTSLGDYAGAAKVLDEAEHESIRAGSATADILLVQSRLALLQRDVASATRLTTAVLTRADSKPNDSQRLSAHILAGLADCQNSDASGAANELAAAKSFTAFAHESAAQSELAGLQGEIHLLSQDFTAAANDFDQQASLARSTGDYRAMTRALAKSGRAAGRSGNLPIAADRLYRAARAAVGRADPDAAALVTEASAAAQSANDANLIHLTAALGSTSTTQPATP